jgi:CDP-6-deoxy-D-xylo-4-hexulose-3-dehydrase
MPDWTSEFLAEWKRRHPPGSSKKILFPLMEENFTEEDVLAMAEVVLSGQLTLADGVRRFERNFAEKLGAPFAVMVNSGSSANLLAVAALLNPQRRRHLDPGDEVLVPAVCWPTSVWSLLQFGLKPVLVDVDPATLNVDLRDLRSKIGPATRAVMSVHILGNAAPMDDLREIIEGRQLLWLEDTCESLGSRALGRALGAFGDFGTFSFYYSHHLTTGEGGMVLCKSQEDADLLRCMRAHGWTRELSNRQQVEAQHADIDPRFCFVNTGFNLRPMEVQAAVGLTQLSRLDAMNRARIENRAAVVKALKAHPRWAGQYEFTEPSKGCEPAWFGFCALLASRYAGRLRTLLDEMSSKGVENRPIVSGNFARQPGLKLLGMNLDPASFPGAEEVHRRGFFLGIHTEPLKPELVQRLADTLLSLDFDGKR